MRVTITFESEDEFDVVSTYSRDIGEGYYEDLLYAFGCAAKGAGFDWNNLTTTTEFNSFTSEF